MINLENRFFTWEKWENFDTLVILFHYVKFIEDFGNFKKGEEFFNVYINYNRKYIVAYNEDKSSAKYQDFHIIPISREDG